MQRFNDEGSWESRWIEEGIQHSWCENLDFAGAREFSWPEEVGAWVSNLICALGVDGYSACEAGGTNKHPGRMIHPEGFETYLFLCFDAGRRVTRCKIRGAGEQNDHQEEIDRWKMASATATARMGDSSQRVWVSLIGTDHHASPTYGEQMRLAGRATIGALTLVAMPESHRERFFYPQGVRRLVSDGWPVAVIGTARCRPDESPIAGTAIKNLCHALSVCTEQRWVVYCEPTVDFNRWESQVRSLYLGSAADQECLASDPPTEFPKGVAPLYKSLEQDERLSRAAGIYSEGLSLLSEHPSLALVCFISVIEIVAESAVETSGHHQRCKDEAGPRKRFREALKTVCKDADEFRHLNQLYRNRSKTVHSGVFYGSDGVFPDVSWDLLSSEGTFTIRVMQMAEAARELIFLRARELREEPSRSE